MTPNSGNSVEGDWTVLPQSLDFKPASVTMPSLNSFSLAYNTGEYSDDDTTADPTVKGTVSHVEPQLYVELAIDGEHAAEDLVIVPVLDDGTFEFTPDYSAYGWLSGTSHAIEARLRLWDPYENADWFSITDWGSVSDVATFVLDDSENVPATIESESLTLLYNVAASGYPQSALPIFEGRVENDGGRLSGLLVEFDHNGDGIIDGSTYSRSDGTFVYEAFGLEPGDLVQTISARVVETDFWGEEFTGEPSTLEFILTRAPLISDLAYSSANDQVTGTVFSDATALEVEYQLFGPDTISSAPSNLAGYSPTTPDTAVVTGSGFTISTSGLQSGPAAVVVRAIDTTDDIKGPWQMLTFTVGGEPGGALTITDFYLANDTGTSGDGETSDPTVRGRFHSSYAAHSLVEILIYDNSSTPVLLATHRTNADAEGEFTFTPPNLEIGPTYVFKARSVYYDAVSGQEIFSDPISLAGSATVTLVSGTAATITGFEQIAPNDATVHGTVVNQDGGVAGLRVEFDHDGNGTADGYAHTDSTGYFVYTPLNLMAGTTAVRARVFEWDPVDQKFEAPDWTDTLVAETNVTLTESGPTEPEMDESLTDTLGAIDYADTASKDAVFAVLDEVGIAAASDDVLDLGFAELRLLHRADGDRLDPEDVITEQLFELDIDYYIEAGQETSSSTSPLQTTTGLGYSLEYCYSWGLSYTYLDVDTYSVEAGLTLWGIDYDTAGDLDVELGEDSQFYTLNFTGTITTFDGHFVQSIEYSYTESLCFDFFTRETTTTTGENSSTTPHRNQRRELQLRLHRPEQRRCRFVPA